MFRTVSLCLPVQICSPQGTRGSSRLGWRRASCKQQIPASWVPLRWSRGSFLPFVAVTRLSVSSGPEHLCSCCLTSPERARHSQGPFALLLLGSFCSCLGGLRKPISSPISSSLTLPLMLMVNNNPLQLCFYFRKLFHSHYAI